MFPSNQGSEISFHNTVEKPEGADNYELEPSQFVIDFGTNNHNNSNIIYDVNQSATGGSSSSRVGRRPRNTLPPLPNNASGEDDKRSSIEKQRRLEMSSLVSKLRFLLPGDYLMGKRSISDHLDRSVSYINGLKENIKKLKDKRDRLQHRTNNTDIHEEGSSSSSSSDITINPTGVGLEIHIRVPLNNERFSLSRAAAVILEEGLTIPTCSYTRVRGSFIYSIHCQVSEEDGCPRVDINLPRLRQRISHVVSSSVL